MLRLLLCLVCASALAAAELPATLFAAAAPADAKAIADTRAAAKAGDTVVVHGYIGGRAKPFAEGKALFTIADSEKAPQCSGADDHCPTPWDACCADKAVIAANSATVQVADADGKPLDVAINGVSGVKPGAKVVIAGTVAASSNEKLLVINATAIHVVP